LLSLTRPIREKNFISLWIQILTMPMMI